MSVKVRLQNLPGLTFVSWCRKLYLVVNNCNFYVKLQLTIFSMYTERTPEILGHGTLR